MVEREREAEKEQKTKKVKTNIRRRVFFAYHETEVAFEDELL